jgi:hypothetical protein
MQGGGRAVLEVAMAIHKFSVGQAVFYSPGWQGRGKSERFKIVRLLPEAENAFQYRVKSQMDGHERVVREDQLAQA